MEDTATRVEFGEIKEVVATNCEMNHRKRRCGLGLQVYANVTWCTDM